MQGKFIWSIWLQCSSTPESFIHPVWSCLWIGFSYSPHLFSWLRRGPGMDLKISVLCQHPVVTEASFCLLQEALPLFGYSPYFWAVSSEYLSLMSSIGEVPGKDVHQPKSVGLIQEINDPFWANWPSPRFRAFLRGPLKGYLVICKTKPRKSCLQIR